MKMLLYHGFLRASCLYYLDYSAICAGPCWSSVVFYKSSQGSLNWACIEGPSFDRPAFGILSDIYLRLVFCLMTGMKYQSPGASIPPPPPDSSLDHMTAVDCICKLGASHSKRTLTYRGRLTC